MTKPIFFTSDWHIYHTNILEFCNRPFKTIDHMHEQLIKNYNNVVPTDGVGYFLGDMGLYSSTKLRPIIDRLHGTKILTLGNHDKGPYGMYESGFDAVVHGITMYIEGYKVTMTHCPLLGVWREDCTKMAQRSTDNWYGEHRLKNKPFVTEDVGQFHLHGHIHSPNGGISERSLDRQFDVGVDANNYAPVSMSYIRKWLRKYKK